MFSAQAVVMGEKVYVGGGMSQKSNHVIKYNTTRDEWSHLPPHHLKFFAMAQFTGNLITVGGGIPGSVTGKVYCFKEESQDWEEFLKPMPTARYFLSVATTQSPSLPVGGLLVSDMARLYPVPLWRCTTMKHLSGTLLTPCLHLTMHLTLLTPATYWVDMMLMTNH